MNNMNESLFIASIIFSLKAQQRFIILFTLFVVFIIINASVGRWHTFKICHLGLAQNLLSQYRSFNISIRIHMTI